MNYGLNAVRGVMEVKAMPSQLGFQSNLGQACPLMYFHTPNPFLQQANRIKHQWEYRIQY